MTKTHIFVLSNTWMAPYTITACFSVLQKFVNKIMTTLTKQ